MIHYYRRMLNIQRLAGVPKHRSYNLAEHSYFTALLFLDICNAIGAAPTAGQLDLVLKHDLLEVFTADLPYPIKNLNDVTKAAWATIEQEAIHANLTVGFLGEYADSSLADGLKELHDVFKAADLLELWIFCTEEQVMGNCSVQIEGVCRKCEDLLSTYSPDIGKACLDIMQKVIAAGRPITQEQAKHTLKAEILPDAEEKFDA